MSSKKYSLSGKLLKTLLQRPALFSSLAIIQLILYMLLLSTFSASAQDELVTKRGVVRGQVIAADINSITIEIPGRGKMTYPRSMVTRIKVTPPPSITKGIKAYEEGNMSRAKLNLGKLMLNFQGLDVDWAQKGLVYFGRASLAEGDYDKAEKAFKSFLLAYHDHPLTTNARIGLAEIERVKKDYDSALQIYNELASPIKKQLKPTDNQIANAAEIYIGTGKCLEAKNNLTGALDSYIKVIALYPAKPFYSEALYRSGTIFIKQNHLEKAEKYFSELIEHYPDSVFASKAIEARKKAKK